MDSDFEIGDGISLVQSPHELDLHNNYDFQDLHYSVEERVLRLHWRRSTGDSVVSPSLPRAAAIEFRNVTEFRFLPRDPELPFTEDDCLSRVGYWTDEGWVFGVIPPYKPDPRCLTAFKFMSGAVIAVQAESAHEKIEA
jgi:hypothetical protein